MSDYSGTRVVLVKPGDVLMIGNVGDIGDIRAFNEALTTMKEALGLSQLLVFEADIDMAALPKESA